jgi:DNA-binding transcriptional LysR family regulator
MQQVRYFVALAETLNFTRAAERCNVSQPSLTRAIKLLEDELGGPLFHRERNNTHLTELGRRVEPHLRRALGDALDARREAGAFARLQAPVLRLGLARGIALAPLARLILRFAREYPTAELALPSADPEELLQALRRGDLEAVIVPHAPGEPDDLHYYPLSEDAPQLVLPEGHRLADGGPPGIEELARETIVCVDRCGHWRAAERELAARGVALRPRIVVGDAPWQLDLVRAGMGVGLLSRHQALGPGLIGRPLAADARVPDLTLATKRGRLYSPPVRAFVEIALMPARKAAAAA